MNVNEKHQLKIASSLLNQVIKFDLIAYLFLIFLFISILWVQKVTLGIIGLTAISIIFFILYLYFRIRVGFDKEIITYLTSKESSLSLKELDEILLHLTLKKEIKETRDWLSRWKAIKRLIKYQIITLLIFIFFVIFNLFYMIEA